MPYAALWAAGLFSPLLRELRATNYQWTRPFLLDSALTERHSDWIEENLRPLIGDDLILIVLNNLTEGPDGKYLNVTFGVAKDNVLLDDDNTYTKVFVPGIEKTYTASGRDDRLVVESRQGH